MDERRFDALARAVALAGVGAPRRRLLAGLGGGALAALLGLSEAEESDAKCVRPGQRCKAKNGKKRKCCGGARCRRTKCKCPRGEQKCGKRCIPDDACCRDRDFCSQAPVGCGPGGDCFCLTSEPDGRTVCSDARIQLCADCTSDAHCTQLLGQESVCVPNGPACEAHCPSHSGMCVNTSCTPCPSGQRRCRNSQCIPDGDCCSDDDCPKDQSCEERSCVPGGCRGSQKPCRGDCIPAADCCTNDDCPPDSTCTAGGRCLADGCSTRDFCAQAPSECGPGNDCFCLTSEPDGHTVCSDARFQLCADCTSDAQCTDLLGEESVCVSNGPECEAHCPSHSGMCVNVSCTPCGSGQRRCRNSQCIPNDGCCSNSECGEDQVCRDNACVCTGNRKLCRGECIPESDCCTNADCPPDSTCTPDRVCKANTCPAIFNFCHGERRCGPDDNCFCMSSFTDQTTVCSDARRHECVNCASDAECTERLGEDAVCLFNGPECEARCPETSRLCVSAGCASCPSGQRRCRNGECHDCCTDADCGPNDACIDGGCFPRTCPPNDLCNEPGSFDVRCAPNCLCATSIDGNTVCTGGEVHCGAGCNSDADCTAAIGEPAVCIEGGPICPPLIFCGGGNFCMRDSCSGGGSAAARAGGKSGKSGKSRWKPLPKRLFPR